jgi:hypothetical protein
VQKQTLFAMTAIATAAITTNRFVGMMTGAPCAAAAKALGVAQYSAAIGEAFTVDVQGTSILEAGAAVAVGDPIKADASARGIPQAGAGVILGYAVTAASAAGQKFEILLEF